MNTTDTAIVKAAATGGSVELSFSIDYGLHTDAQYRRFRRCERIAAQFISGGVDPDDAVRRAGISATKHRKLGTEGRKLVRTAGGVTPVRFGKVLAEVLNDRDLDRLDAVVSAPVNV